MADSATVYMCVRACDYANLNPVRILSFCPSVYPLMPARPISLKSIVLTFFTENVPITAVNYDLLWIDQVQAEDA